MIFCGGTIEDKDVKSNRNISRGRAGGFAARIGEACGTRMYPGTPYERADGKAWRYTCNWEMGGCGRVSLATEPVLEYVVDAVVFGDWLSPGGSFERYVQDQHARAQQAAPGTREAIDKIKAQRRGLAGRIDGNNLRLDKLDPESAEAYDIRERIVRLRAEDTGHASRLVHLEAELAKAKGGASAAWPPPSLEDFKGWDDPKQQRDFLRQYIAKIIIHPVGQGARTFDPRAVEIVPTWFTPPAWVRPDDLGHPDNGECVLGDCHRKRQYSLPPKGSGLCSVHETRRRGAQARGDDEWDRGPELHRRPPRGTCEAEFEGKLCGRKNRAEGLCIMHYGRMKTARDRGLGDDWDRSPEPKQGHRGYHHGRAPKG